MTTRRGGGSAFGQRHLFCEERKGGGKENRKRRDWSSEVSNTSQRREERVGCSPERTRYLASIDEVDELGQLDRRHRPWAVPRLALLGQRTGNVIGRPIGQGLGRPFPPVLLLLLPWLLLLLLWRRRRETCSSLLAVRRSRATASPRASGLEKVDAGKRLWVERK
jgi:hypothetical protein